MSSAFTRRSCIAVLLIAGLLGTACTSSDDSSSATTVAEDDVTATTSGASESNPVSTTQEFEGSTTSWDPSAVADQAAADLAAVAPMTLIQFGQAWADANWEAMAAVADGAVVTAATESHVTGAAPPITGENVDAIIESCEAQTEESMWACQLEYGDPGAPATFAMTIGQTKSGLRIIELAPIGA
jgi:hypothetical protein